MLPSSFFLSSKPVFMSVHKAPVKSHRKQVLVEKKTEHSNIRGLWTTQMHSERPLIKIISTGDGRKKQGPAWLTQNLISVISFIRD